MMTYQSMLKNELLVRQRKNAAYSMRSFARDLDVSQSFLSQILSYKRKLSDEKALIISERLKFRSTQKKIFVSLVRLELNKNAVSQKLLQTEIDSLLRKSPQFNQLSEDTFNIVADWYYFAILELTTTQNFKPDMAWIAKQFRLPLSQVEIAVERLCRVGLLEIKEGRWQKLQKDYLFENVASMAIRRHHHQTLDLAKAALGSQLLNEREFFTISMPTDPKKINRAKELIREFSESFMAEMEQSEPKAVYKLAVQFFRLDQPKENT